MRLRDFTISVLFAVLMLAVIVMAAGLYHQAHENSRLEHFQLTDPDDQCNDIDTPEGIRLSPVCQQGGRQ